MPKSDQSQAALVPVNEQEDSHFIAVFFGPDPAEVQVRYLYRGDARAPEGIFSHGFSARGEDRNLAAHVNNVSGHTKSGYVSTSTTPARAAKFPWHRVNGFLYQINGNLTGIDVVKEIKGGILKGRFHPEDAEFFRRENEFAVQKKIQPRDIKGAWKIKAIKNEFGSKIDFEQGDYIPNPSYLPPNAGLRCVIALAHPSLTGIGVYREVQHLWSVYQESEQGGNFDLFYNECAKSIAGWSAAYALGVSCGVRAAAATAALGPGISLASGAIAGLAGSILGYMAGKNIEVMPAAAASSFESRPQSGEPARMGLGDVLRRLNPRQPQERVVDEVRSFFAAERKREARLFQSVAPGEVGSKLSDAMRQKLQKNLPKVVASAYETYRDIQDKASPTVSVPDYCAQLVGEQAVSEKFKSTVTDSFVEQMAEALHGDEYAELKKNYDRYLFDHIRAVREEQVAEKPQKKPTEQPKASASSFSAPTAEPSAQLPRSSEAPSQMAWPDTMKDGVSDVQHGATALAIFAQHAGNKPMAQGFSKIATGAMCCAPMASAITAGLAVTPGAGMLAFAGVLIASEGTGNLFGFDFGDDEGSDALQGISLQLEVMYALLLEVYQLQVKTLQVVIEEFKNLNETIKNKFKKTFLILEKMARASSESFSELKAYVRDNAIEIRQELAELRRALPEINEAMSVMAMRQVLGNVAVLEAVRGLYTEPDRRLATRLRRHLETLEHSSSELALEDVRHYSRKLASAALDEAQRGNVTAADTSLDLHTQDPVVCEVQHQHFVDTVVQSFGKPKQACYHGVAAYHVAALSRLVENLGCAQDSLTMISNPLLLQDRIAAMVELYRFYISENNAPVKIPTEHVHELGRVEAPLHALQTFYHGVRVRPLFEKLMANLLQALAEFEKEAEKQIQEFTKTRVVEPALTARKSALLSQQAECRRHLASLPKPTTHETWEDLTHQFGRDHFTPHRIHDLNNNGHTLVYSGEAWLAFRNYPLPLPDSRSPARRCRYTVRTWKEFVKDESGEFEEPDERRLQHVLQEFKTGWGRDPVKVEKSRYPDNDLSIRGEPIVDSWRELVSEFCSFERWVEIFSQGSKVDEEKLNRSLFSAGASELYQPLEMKLKELLERLIAFNSGKLKESRVVEFAKQEQEARKTIETGLAKRETYLENWDLFNAQNAGSTQAKTHSPRFALPTEGSVVKQRLLIDLNDPIFRNKHLKWLEEFGVGKLHVHYQLDVLSENDFQREVRFTLFFQLELKGGEGVLIPIFSPNFNYDVATFYSLDEVVRAIWYGMDLSSGHELDLSCREFTQTKHLVSLPQKTLSFLSRLSTSEFAKQYWPRFGARFSDRDLPQCKQAWESFLSQQRRACSAHLAEKLKQVGHPLRDAMQRVETVAGVILSMTAWLQPNQFSHMESVLQPCFEPALLHTLADNPETRFTEMFSLIRKQLKEYQAVIPAQFDEHAHDGHIQILIEQVRAIHRDVISHNEKQPVSKLKAVEDENASLRQEVRELKEMMKQMMTFFKLKPDEKGEARSSFSASKPN